MKTCNLLLVLFVLFLGVLTDHKVNQRPIIGILDQPTGSTLSKFGKNYIAASYVKYFESAGARVVPVFHNSSQSELDDIFNSINGLLFPGGGADLVKTKLYYSAEYLYKKALTAYDNGDYFPLFGHCMGFELLSIITSQDFNILSGYNAENITLPLQFVPNYKQSKWFGSSPEVVDAILRSQPVTMNNHREGLSPDDFTKNQNLNSFYRVLSYNQDRDGKTFVSTMEGIKYPVFAMQWHAEKPQFEWNPSEVINHSYDAITAMQYFANFAVQQARQNMHFFRSRSVEEKALIYNFPLVYTEVIEPDFETCYFFQN